MLLSARRTLMEAEVEHCIQPLHRSTILAFLSLKDLVTVFTTLLTLSVALTQPKSLLASIGIIISPWGVDRYNYPSPLFIPQLRELAEEFRVQYWVVSFTGWSRANSAREDISTFVAAWVSIHGLPFCGFRVAKSLQDLRGNISILRREERGSKCILVS